MIFPVSVERLTPERLGPSYCFSFSTACLRSRGTCVISVSLIDKNSAQKVKSHVVWQSALKKRARVSGLVFIMSATDLCADSH